MATYKEKADLISIGAYQPGTDPAIDAAIQARGPIDGFLRQGVTEPSTAEEADAHLAQLATLGGSFQPPVLDGEVVSWVRSTAACRSTTRSRRSTSLP